MKLALETDKNRLRTFPSLMSTVYEEQLLEWHSTGQLALVDVAKGTARKIGAPAMIRAIDVAPDGKYVRVTRMVKPFSYDVPVNNFGSIEEIWDQNGKAIATVTDRPLNLGVQDDTPDPADTAAAAAAAAASRTASARWPGGPTARVSPSSNRSRLRRVRLAATGPTTIRPPTISPPPADAGAPEAARAPPPEGSRLSVAAAVRRLEPEAGLREPDADLRATGIPPTCRCCSSASARDRTRSNRPCTSMESAKKYTLARYRTDDVYTNPGAIVSARGTAAAGGRGGRGGGAAAGPVMVSADSTSVFFLGIVYDRKPADVAPKSFVDRVGDQDRSEGADFRERQRGHQRARDPRGRP